MCDDGSTDDIEGALQPYRGRVSLIRKGNGSEASAKNTAAQLASGDFVVILDADDVWLQGRLEALGDLAAARPDLDILTTDAQCESDGRVLSRYYDVYTRFWETNQRLGILESNFVFSHAAVRRRRWLDVGGFDTAFPIGADWEFWQRLILSGSLVGLVDEPLAIYRLATGSLTSSWVALQRWRIAVRHHVMRRSDLSPAERTAIAHRLEEDEQKLVLAQAQGALSEGGWNARRYCWAIIRGRGYSPRTRAKAAMSMLLPSLAGRRMLHRTDLRNR